MPPKSAHGIAEKHVSVYIPRAWHRELLRLAVQRGQSQAALMRQAFQEWLDRQLKQEERRRKEE